MQKCVHFAGGTMRDDDDDGIATKSFLLLNYYLQTSFFPSPGFLVQSSLLSIPVRPANQPLRASVQLEVTATPEEATWQCVAARKRDESAQRAHRALTSSSISSISLPELESRRRTISRKYKRRSGRGRGRDRKDKNALQLSLLVSCESVCV